MKDEKGLYYFPFPGNPRLRMYVRQGSESISFRLWNAEDPRLWEEHDWVPYDAIKEAAALYKGRNFDPERAYDLCLARALIREDQ